MAIACVLTRACCGVEAPQVTVEVHISNGLPSLNLVGLQKSIRQMSCCQHLHQKVK